MAFICRTDMKCALNNFFDNVNFVSYIHLPKTLSFVRIIIYVPFWLLEMEYFDAISLAVSSSRKRSSKVDLELKIFGNYINLPGPASAILGI